MHNQNVVTWGHRIPFLHSLKPRYQKTIKLFLVKKLQFSIYFIYNFYLLHQCDFNSLENHVCFVLKNLKLVNHRFFSLASKSIEDLPRIYLNNPGVLPKPKRGKFVVSIMSLIRKFGSFSGIVLVIRHMLNFSGWNPPWLFRLLCPRSRFITLDLFWKKKEWVSWKTFYLFFVDIDF